MTAVAKPLPLLAGTGKRGQEGVSLSPRDPAADPSVSAGGNPV